MILKAKSANADAVLTLPTPPDGMRHAQADEGAGLQPELSDVHPRRDGLAWGTNLGKDGDCAQRARLEPRLQVPGGVDAERRATRPSTTSRPRR